MKTRISTAIIFATTMMITLMGCGAASTDTDSSSDAVSVAEVNTDLTDKTTDNTSSDSAFADSSDVAGTTIASVEDSFTYKGETFSIFDDLQTFLSKINAVGTPSPDTPVEVEELGTHIYDYDGAGSDFDFSMCTINKNGTESVGKISLMGSNVKTSKGITSGSTVEELTSVYGEPTFKAYEGKIYFYENDKYVTSFDVRDGKVFAIYYYATDYYNSNVKPNL